MNECVFLDFLLLKLSVAGETRVFVLSWGRLRKRKIKHAKPVAAVVAA